MKSYYSRGREALIDTDVSIELYLPMLDELAIIWIWECKCYSEAAPVEIR
jgi:hypothetical protein